VIRGFFLSDPAKHTAIGDLHPSRNSICKVIDAPPWSALELHVRRRRRAAAADHN